MHSPSIVLSTAREGLQVAEFPASFTDRLPMGKFAQGIPAGRWVQVRIPLSEFHTGSIYEFRSSYLQNVVFHQGRADGARLTDGSRNGRGPGEIGQAGCESEPSVFLAPV